MLYWFTHTFSGFERFRPYFAPDEAKMFIWSDEISGPSGDGAVSRYYVAHILRNGIGHDEEVSLAAACEELGAHDEVIPGGCYAVFWTVDDLEAHSLEDAFQLLTRCAFGGWVRDNRWRVDFERRTFVAWGNRTLRFYVPTIG